MNFHDNLKLKIDSAIHKIYKCTKDFPREEIYGVTSQLRRASLSVMLNYIEGFARINNNVYRNFIEISYGSLKETNYLVYFSYTEKYIPENQYEAIMKELDEIGAMLWSLLVGKKEDCKKNKHTERNT